MHIALFSPTWGLSTPNGIVTYVRWMAHEFRRQGHRVSIIAGLLAGTHECAVEVAPLMSLRLRSWFLSKTGAGEKAVFAWGEAIAKAINKIHRADPIDVIEMEESFGWFADVARLTSIPTVVKLHGPAFMSLVEDELDSSLSRARIEREGAALRTALVLTSPAQATLDATISRYQLSPLVCRHVVNPIGLLPADDMWNAENCERKTLLFVGRFDKRKGGDLVLRAAANLMREDLDLRLVFIGPDVGVVDETGKRVSFEAFASSVFDAEPLSRVKFLGSQTPEQVSRLRARSFLTVIASRWENQSYTALEAMLQGCPVVSSDAGGQKEIIRDGESGLLATAGDALDLGRKIRLMLDDPTQAVRLADCGQRYVASHHSPSRVVAMTLQVYREAIEIGAKNRRSAVHQRLGGA